MNICSSSDSKNNVSTPSMRDIPDKVAFRMWDDAERLPEEKFINEYFGMLMRRFGDDVNVGYDEFIDGWEIASEGYNAKQLAGMFAHALGSIYGKSKVSVEGNVATLDIDGNSGVTVSIYEDDNASTFAENQKGYSVSIQYYE